MRVVSAPVIRLAGARPTQLGHVARADGAWRLYVLDDDGDQARTTLEQLPAVVERFLSAGAGPDSVIDVRTVFRRPHPNLDVGDHPDVLRPRKGRFGLVDHEESFCPDPAADVFTECVIDPAGCLVLARPDQHVASVLPLTTSQSSGPAGRPAQSGLTSARAMGRDVPQSALAIRGDAPA